MAQNDVHRTLMLKAVDYKTRRKGFKPIPLDKALAQIDSKHKSAQQVLWPPFDQAKPEEHDRYWFLHALKSTPQGYRFQCVSFTPNELPTSFPLDFSSRNVDLKREPVRDDSGEPRQVGHVMHCLALNELVLMEAAGGTGGTDKFARYLTELIRLYCGDPKYPRIHLADTYSSDVHQLIQQGKGARSVELAVATPPTKSGGRYVAPTNQLREKVGGTQRFSVCWDAGAHSSLSEDQVAAAYEEAEEYGVDRVTITLNDGGTIHLGKYRLKRRMPFPVPRGGQPSAHDLFEALRLFMIDLKQAKIVTADGRLHQSASIDSLNASSG